MDLTTYKKKRNFSKTPEPTGETDTIAHANKNIFVVQKHLASHLHYDFRLAINGVLKSWAIPKGPSLNPHNKRLAVMTEDHPLEYANFEGIIPPGEYGAGTVIIWDQGMWEAIGDLNSALRQHKIVFTLYGKKLRGAWTLLGFKNDPKNWLLIKKHDQYATDEEDDGLLATPSVVSNLSLTEIAQVTVK